MAAAQRLIELRNGSVLGHREMLLQLASPAKLLNQLFPVSSLVWAEGLRPISPTGELAVPTEIIRTAELAIADYTQHTSRCPERPFRAFASLIAKVRRQLMVAADRAVPVVAQAVVLVARDGRRLL